MAVKPEKQAQAQVGPASALTFSESQLETVNAIFRQMDELQSNLNFFLNHVIREGKLPQIEGGYTLTADRRGLIPRSEQPQLG